MKVVGYGEGVDYVTCRLCRVRFKAINSRHLIRVHGFRSKDPLGVYRQQYSLKSTWCLGSTRALSHSLIRFHEKELGEWTASDVVEKIKRLRRTGRLLTARRVGKNHRTLMVAAVRHFNTWNEALKASGIDPAGLRQHREWTSQAVIRSIRSLRRSGVAVSYRALHLRDRGIIKAALARFGTWDKALRAAGLDPSHVRGNRPWDPDLVLDRLRQMARMFAPGELRLHDKRLVAISNFYFRGLRMALEVAGAVPRVRWQAPIWSRRKVLAEMRAHVRGGGSLGFRLLFRERPEMIGAALEAFGSWRAAVAASGFRLNRPMTRQKWTRPDLLTLLSTVYQKHGKVTAKLLRRESPAGYASPTSDIAPLFGSLAKAVQKIGREAD